MQSRATNFEQSELGVWYGHQEIAVFVDWTSGRVVGLLRHEEDQTWSVRVCLPPKRTARAKQEGGTRLHSNSPEPFRHWIGKLGIKSAERAYEDVEAFFPHLECIRFCLA
jgi:hypothetical protein